MAQTGVFISYNHKDKRIAEAVVESLTALSPNLEVFIDHAGIEGGDDYETKISESIQKSQWFVFICSGGDKSEKEHELVLLRGRPVPGQAGSFGSEKSDT
jgi:hypothetical protein